MSTMSGALEEKVFRPSSDTDEDNSLHRHHKRTYSSGGSEYEKSSSMTSQDEKENVISPVPGELVSIVLKALVNTFAGQAAVQTESQHMQTK